MTSPTQQRYPRRRRTRGFSAAFAPCVVAVTLMLSSVGALGGVLGTEFYRGRDQALEDIQRKLSQSTFRPGGRNGGTPLCYLCGQGQLLDPTSYSNIVTGNTTCQDAQDAGFTGTYTDEASCAAASSEALASCSCVDGQHGPCEEIFFLVPQREALEIGHQ